MQQKYCDPHSQPYNTTISKKMKERNLFLASRHLVLSKKGLLVEITACELKQIPNIHCRYGIQNF